MDASSLTIGRTMGADILEDDAYETVVKGAIAKLPKHQAALVVYTPNNINAIRSVTQDGHYCSAANSPLTLVARVVEAGYVADSIKR